MRLPLQPDRASRWDSRNLGSTFYPISIQQIIANITVNRCRPSSLVPLWIYLGQYHAGGAKISKKVQKPDPYLLSHTTSNPVADYSTYHMLPTSLSILKSEAMKRAECRLF